MFRTILLIGALGACSIGQAHASSYQLNRLEPLDAQVLSSYRGGFKFDSDYIINIGLSIRTSINGDTLFTNSIANLLIENGRFVMTRPAESIPSTTIVQVGAGNVVALPSGQTTAPAQASTPAQPGGASMPSGVPLLNPSQVSISQVVAPVPTFDQSSITSIIQNSLDGTVVGFDTVINIDAQIGGVIRQLERSNKLQQALQIHLY